ncbi:DUF2141 domain-containing protein [Pseudoalteromonas xiamenensis]
MKHTLVLAATMLTLMGCQSTNSASINANPGKPTELTVRIENVQNTDGKLLVLLHDNSESYYADDNVKKNGARYFAMKAVVPQTPTTLVQFKDIPAGRYAVSVVHDEDDDGKLDRMVFPFLGMPSEPYALSNNTYNTFSKGDFEAALVTVDAPQSTIALQLATHLSKLTGL